MSKRKYIKPSMETIKENSVTVQEVSSEPSNLPEKVEEKTVGGITEENKTETEKVIETSDSVSLESIQGLNPTFAVLDEVSLENADTISHDTHSTVDETEMQEDSVKKVETFNVSTEENVSRETIKEPSEEVVTKPTTVTPEIKETYVINLKCLSVCKEHCTFIFPCSWISVTVFCCNSICKLIHQCFCRTRTSPSTIYTVISSNHFSTNCSFY